MNLHLQPDDVGKVTVTLTMTATVEEFEIFAEQLAVNRNRHPSCVVLRGIEEQIRKLRPAMTEKVEIS